MTGTTRTAPAKKPAAKKTTVKKTTVTAATPVGTAVKAAVNAVTKPKKGPYVVLFKQPSGTEPFYFVARAANNATISDSAGKYAKREAALKAIGLVHPGLRIVEKNT